MHGDSEAPTGPPGPAPRVPVSVGELVDLGLVDRLPAAVYTASCGDDPAWLYVSPQVEAILGCRPEELVADPGLWARCLHPEDRDRVLREEQALRRAPARGCSEYRFRRPDGRVVWVLDDVSVVPDERFGSVQRGLLYDITHRKRTEMLFAEHAAIVERIARGDDLRSVLTEVAKATRRVSEDARCVIVLDELPGTGANLVVDASGPVPRAGVAGPGGTPVRGAAGRPVGSVRLLHPTEGDVDRDDDLLAWAARLVALAVDRATQDERMLTSLSLLEATLESTADGILVVDATGRIVGHNQKFRHMWQVSEELMRAGDDERVLESVLEQLVDPDGFVEQVRALYGTPEASSFDVLEFHDGRVFERFSQPQRVDGRSVGRVWSFRDMTAHRHLQDQLRTLAYRDPLTPLPNRALFTERLTAALSGRGRSRLRPGLLLLDIDDFKTVNDGLGHAAGDELLLAVADRLPRCIREGDVAARLGGDEFVVLLHDVPDPADAEVVARRVLSALSAPVVIGGQVVTARASLGIALAAGDRSERAADLLRDADLAMYTAKRAGGGAYRFFEPGMRREAVDRLELKADLEHALDRGQLSLQFQPVVALGEGRVVGAEALLRWRHPTRGPVPPAEFVPLAEETGIINRLGRWVLREACRHAAAWQDGRESGDPLLVSVNVSPRQLADPHLPGDLASVLRSAGLPPAALMLEITEGALVQSAVDVVESLEALKRLGVGLALDDFGTGYSSLGYLDRYPLDTVKIDRSFVARLGVDGSGDALVRAVLHVAEALRLDVVAEGIETAEQLAALRGLGCRRGQGHHLSAPLDADVFGELLTAAGGGSVRPVRRLA
ncbi:MAG TPA: EAL domain-containing protein [Actinomycetes bacterium]